MLARSAIPLTAWVYLPPYNTSACAQRLLPSYANSRVANVAETQFGYSVRWKELNSVYKAYKIACCGVPSGIAKLTSGR